MENSMDTLRKEVLRCLREKPRSVVQMQKESGVERQAFYRFLREGGNLHMENWLKMEKYLVKLQQEVDNELSKKEVPEL